MNEKQDKGLIASFVEQLLFGIPGFIGKKTFEGIQDLSNLKLRVGLFSAVGTLSLITFFLLRLFRNLFHTLVLSGWNGILFCLVIFYIAYLLLTLPFFLLLAYGSKEMGEKLLEKDGKKEKRPIPESEIKNARGKAAPESAYLGSSFWTGKPLYISDQMRTMHTHCVGSTGVGKTESVLLPLLRHDIEAGHGAIVIDAKGDLELLAKIRLCVEKAKREHDFLFFSLSHPEISRTYNPLLRGNASEIKDKLIGATEWREEFYKKKCEEALLTLLRPMIEMGRKVKFKDLYYLLTDIKDLKNFRDEVGEGLMADDLQNMMDHFRDNNKFLSGIIADLALITKSEFGRLVDVDESQIDLLKVYEENKILYCSLNTQGFEETARRFGRLILQDIKTVSNEIQTQKKETERHFFPVFVDEFSSFVYDNFIEFLNKGRGAKFAITLLHQSLADLATKRTTFQQQILENTNIKIIMRQDDPLSIEKFAKIGGAKRTIVSTYQTEERMLGTGLTGQGSLREGQTFRIDPDLVRALGRGEAIVVSKAPGFHIDYIQLDYEKIKTDEMMAKIKEEKDRAIERLKQEKILEQNAKKEKGLKTLADIQEVMKERKKKQEANKAK